jgi:hypothetical protein
MTLDEFWSVIEDARKGSSDEVEISGRVQQSLQKATAEAVKDFEEHRCRLMEESYTWELWGAAYIINGGCSDDGFDYFRGWLFTQGRSVFELALQAPDSLADIVDDEVECEDFLYATYNAYESLTGKEIDGGVIRLPDLGEGWDFDDDEEMSRRYPRLWAKFCG